jgi:hypothetical protein
MHLRLILVRFSMSAALALVAVVGGGWKWDKVPF